MLIHYIMMLLAHKHKTYIVRSGFSCYWETISKLYSELEFTSGLGWRVSIILLVFFARREMFTLFQGSTNVILFAEDILYFGLMFLNPTFLFLFSDVSVGRLQSLARTANVFWIG